MVADPTIPLDGARVLVTHASRMGSTAEIGEAIAERLRAAGLDVTVVSVSQAPDPEGFDAVVCSSAIYATRWVRGRTPLHPPTSPDPGGAADLAVRERAVRRRRRAAPPDLCVGAASGGEHRQRPA
jgi:NAD(P)-dependent dehydrogenase (short-subunit alcohol dehydrogenase family)